MFRRYIVVGGLAGVGCKGMKNFFVMLFRGKGFIYGSKERKKKNNFVLFLGWRWWKYR